MRFSVNSTHTLRVRHTNHVLNGHTHHVLDTPILYSTAVEPHIRQSRPDSDTDHVPRIQSALQSGIGPFGPDATSKYCQLHEIDFDGGSSSEKIALEVNSHIDIDTDRSVSIQIYKQIDR